MNNKTLTNERVYLRRAAITPRGGWNIFVTTAYTGKGYVYFVSDKGLRQLGNLIGSDRQVLISGKIKRSVSGGDDILVDVSLADAVAIAE